jgi:DmsE family decaheme c-type cytochrome
MYSRILWFVVSSFCGVLACTPLLRADALPGRVHGRGAVSQPAAVSSPSNPPSNPPSNAVDDRSDYVGAETCKACHQELYESWEKSAHWKTTLRANSPPAQQGCESCHGPGAAHVAGGGDKTKIFIFKEHSAKEVNERCLSCHASGPHQMNALNSEHARNDVSCISCHSPHHAKTANFLLVKAQPELCYSCHTGQKAQFQMPFHHRVEEGLINCSDCHNPHGTVGPRQVRTSQAGDAVCFTCHADKRGPFVYEHEPVKVEGCQSCHTPHGSPNAHMLKVSNVNLLCLSCHTTSFANAPGAPSFHNQAAQYQACTVCHVQVHGSNVDHTLFK